MKKKISLIVGCFLGCGIILYGLQIFLDYKKNQFFRPFGDRGEIYQSKEITNGKFKIKIDAHYETGVYLGGAYFVLSSASAETGEFREIVWSKEDDPHPVDEQQFHFINEQTGFPANDQVFAVTVDSGQTWNVWKATEQLKDWHYSYTSIKNVSIEPDGKGLMTLVPFPEKFSSPEFQTNEYGKNWSLVKTGE